MNWLKHSLWFGPILAMSLALKSQSASVTVEDSNETLRLAASHLQHRAFEVRIENIGNGRLTVKRGRCSAQLRLMDSHATADTFYRSTLREFPHIRYAWRGSWYDSRPWLGPLLEFYAVREVARQGIVISRKPLWIAGLGPDCPTAFPAAFSTAPLTMRRR